jgi:hypothetical protein
VLEHGHQGDTIDVGIALTSGAPTHRGLYVGVTRGRDENRIHVVTELGDLTEARDVLEAPDKDHQRCRAERVELVAILDRLAPAWGALRSELNRVLGS